MRFTKIFFAFTLLLLCSCNRSEEGPSLKQFRVESAVRYTYHEQHITIDFKTEGDDVEVSVQDDAEWTSDLTVTSNKSISAHLSENSGAERIATITLTAPGYKSAKIRLTQNGIPTTSATHTLMFYFFGTSLNRYFNVNINDAKLAIEKGALGDNNRVVFFRQRNANEAYIAELCYDSDSGKCFESIVEDNIVIKGNPISPEYISTTLNKLSSIAPAERYGLVMAGHGQAWITREMLNGAAGISQSSLRIPLFSPAPGAEITRALGENNVQVNPSEIAAGINGSAIDIDYILFDACFMSNIETVYELRTTANYIIASPCEIMGSGFPYERTLPYLFQDNGATTDYDGAAKSYYLYYRDEYLSSMRCGSISVFDCSEIEALKEATKELVKSAVEEYDTKSLQTYEGQPRHYFYDFGEWAKVVATDSAALQNFNTQLDKSVIATYTLDSFYSAYGSFGTYPINVEVYSGVTTSAPSEVLNSDWQKTEWYKSVWQL